MIMTVADIRCALFSCHVFEEIFRITRIDLNIFEFVVTDKLSISETTKYFFSIEFFSEPRCEDKSFNFLFSYAISMGKWNHNV